MLKRAALWVMLAGAILLLSCSGATDPGGRNQGKRAEALNPAPRTWEDSVLEARRRKDLQYKQERDSPIPDKDRERFQGLAYFPVDPAFRFQVQLHRHARPQRIRLGTNTGEMRDALRYGYVEIEVDGRLCRLQAYRTEDSQSAGRPFLFIPFRDATSGRESYGGGRYLDLEENTTGLYDLDFNLAYNPLCAYGKDYSCPVPPEENRLPVAIRAGEKAYPLAALLALSAHEAIVFP